MISYCIACYRPPYARALIDELARKTSVPYEILLWLNVEDEEFEEFLRARMASGVPLRIIGKTPWNIGMAAYLQMFDCCRFDLVTQIDDDVVCLSPYIAETTSQIFSRFPQIGMLAANVWQDEHTTGARPPINQYRTVDAEYGLSDGPIDGWFAVYRKSALHVCRDISPARCFALGSMIKKLLQLAGMQALLCTRMQVFHVIGPAYASYFGMLDFEIEKYRELGREEIVQWYTDARPSIPPREELHRLVLNIRANLSVPPASH